MDRLRSEEHARDAPRGRASTSLGWLGMSMVVVAFASANLHWIDRAALYFAMNAVGSLLLCASNVARRNYQSLSLNGIWASIAVVSIVEGMFA